MDVRPAGLTTAQNLWCLTFRMAVQEIQDEICRRVLCTLFPVSGPGDRIISMTIVKMLANREG